MINKKKIIGAHVEELMCDKCGVVMKCDEVLMLYPPQYRYSCPECKDSFSSFEQYPRTILEFEGDESEI